LSEEWRIETEARVVLAMSKEQRDAFFNGRKDEDGKPIDRRLVGIRGLKSAKAVMETMRKLPKARDSKRRDSSDDPESGCA
jgi:hypothetical protein